MVYLIAIIALALALLTVFIFGDKLGFSQVKMISAKYRIVICAIIVLAAIIDFGFVKTVILG
jgi:hypothetical protein